MGDTADWTDVQKTATGKEGKPALKFTAKVAAEPQSSGSKHLHRKLLEGKR